MCRHQLRLSEMCVNRNAFLYNANRVRSLNLTRCEWPLALATKRRYAHPLGAAAMSLKPTANWSAASLQPSNHQFFSDCVAEQKGLASFSYSSLLITIKIITISGESLFFSTFLRSMMSVSAQISNRFKTHWTSSLMWLNCKDLKVQLHAQLVHRNNPLVRVFVLWAVEPVLSMRSAVPF